MSCTYLAHHELQSAFIFVFLSFDDNVPSQKSRHAAELRISWLNFELKALSFALIKQEKKACSVINSVRHQLCMECRLNEPMQESIFQSSSVQELHTKMKQGCSRVQWWHLSGDEGFSRILGLYRCKAPSKRKSSAKMSGVSS